MTEKGMFGSYRRSKQMTGGKTEKGKSDLGEPGVIVATPCQDFPLHSAVRCSPSVVIPLCPATTQLDRPDHDGNTPLHLAVERGYDKWVDYLLAHRADVNVVNKCDMSPLLLAVRHGHGNLVLQLLSHGANQHYVTRQGQTALHYAACVGDRGIMNTLLQYNVKVNLQDIEGTTALIIACKMRQPEMVKQLLKHKTVAKTNPNLCDKQNRSPLHWATEIGDVESARALIDANADLNLADSQMATPFVCAIKQNNLQVLDVLMESGCDRADIDGLTGTATTLAAFLGRTEVMRRLLDSGEDVNEFGHLGFTPLTAAAFESHTETVQFLLSRGADPNFPNRHGSTALIKAAVCVQDRSMEARHQITRELLRAGADPNQRSLTAGTYYTAYTKGRNCAMSYALSGGVFSLARMHLIAGCRVTLAEVQLWEEADYDCVGSTPILRFLRAWVSVVPSLRSQCRRVIRGALGSRAAVPDDVFGLPIPQALAAYLRFSDLDDIQPELEEAMRNKCRERLSLGPASCCLKNIQGTLAYDMYAD